MKFCHVFRKVQLVIYKILLHRNLLTSSKPNSRPTAWSVVWLEVLTERQEKDLLADM